MDFVLYVSLRYKWISHIISGWICMWRCTIHSGSSTMIPATRLWLATSILAEWRCLPGINHLPGKYHIRVITAVWRFLLMNSDRFLFDLSLWLRLICSWCADQLFVASGAAHSWRPLVLLLFLFIRSFPYLFSRLLGSMSSVSCLGNLIYEVFTLFMILDCSAASHTRHLTP